MLKKILYNNSFIPPEEVEQMTDEEYYELLITHIIMSENEFENKKFTDFDDYVMSFNKKVERDLIIENEHNNS